LEVYARLDAYRQCCGTNELTWWSKMRNGDVWPSVPIIVAIWSDEYRKS